MHYRLIVWDFDGTLADTMPLALATYNGLAARHGFQPVEDPVSVRGMSTRTFLRHHGISLVRLPRLVKEYQAATRNCMDTIRLFDGLPELLRSLKASGYRQGVLSSNSAANIGACLRANGVEHVFDFVVGCPRLFGKARAIRRLLKKGRVEPREFLYIGDEIRDVEAARQARVDVAAVGWGLHSLEFLAQHAPTFLWPSPTDILLPLSRGVRG
jgi:phosphoglycolate phosphatase